MAQPKIYIFGKECCSSPSKTRLYVAVAEDGTVLHTTNATSDYAGRVEMGVTPYTGGHVRYKAKYPQGFEVVWVPCGGMHPALAAFFFPAALQAQQQVPQ